MIRCYTIRLRPTKRQLADLDRILLVSCDLYNAALGERISAWETCRKSISYFDQTKEFAELRKVDQDSAWIPSDLGREPLRRVNLAFAAFFRRCRRGQTPGFPRWKSKSRYASFGTSLVRISGDRLLLPKMGVRFRTHREIRGAVMHCTVARIGKKWKATISCDIGPAPDKKTVTSAVGIDLGLEAFVYCSDGNHINNPRWTASEADKIAQRQRDLIRKKRGSKNRDKSKSALAKAYARVRNCRSNFIHHTSKQLIAQYDLIAYEKLATANLARRHFAKSILDAAWSQLIGQIIYKAEYAGGWAVAVNPRGTSQRCSSCGAVKKKTLSERIHECPCGAKMNRDLNAAINVLALGRRDVGISAEARYAQDPASQPTTDKGLYVGIDYAFGEDAAVYTCSVCGNSAEPCKHYAEFCAKVKP